MLFSYLYLCIHLLSGFILTLEVIFETFFFSFVQFFCSFFFLFMLEHIPVVSITTFSEMSTSPHKSSESQPSVSEDIGKDVQVHTLTVNHYLHVYI